MTVQHGVALKLRTELARLRQRHGVEPLALRTLPSFPPTSAPQWISGLAASTVTIDSERTLFAPRSLSCKTFPPLLYRHSGPIVGRIVGFEHRSDGLYLMGIVDDPTAMLARGLSVCATVHAFELRETHDPKRFHGLITAATLDEVSLTHMPSNDRCLISERTPVLYHGDHVALQARLARVSQLTEQLRVALRV